MSCDAPGEEMDGCDEQPGSGGRDGLFKVLGETAVAAEPCQRSFDDPAARENHGALCGIGPLDDLDGPFADAAEGFAQLVAGIAAIGEQVSQPGKPVDDLGEQQRHPVTVLDIGSVDDGMDQIAPGIGEDSLPASIGLRSSTRNRNTFRSLA